MKEISASEFFDRAGEWAQALLMIRDAALKAGLEETVKWGVPMYTFNGQNVLGLGHFKSYAGIWFHQGVLLKDPHKKLVNAQEGITKAQRQWRFQKPEEVASQIHIVELYINEAMELAKAGKKIKPAPKPPLAIPMELKNAFRSNPQAADAYKALSPYKQREYCEYIEEAKQEATRLRRLQKVLPLLEAGLGLNDKYR